MPDSVEESYTKTTKVEDIETLLTLEAAPTGLDKDYHITYSKVLFQTTVDALSTKEEIVSKNFGIKTIDFHAPFILPMGSSD